MTTPTPTPLPEDGVERPAAELLGALRDRLTAIGAVVVAFSGGVDSGLVAHQAWVALGDRALAVTAASPSLPAAELEGCAGMARSWGLRWRAVQTDELDRAAYRANDADRCWHCKSALMDGLAPIAEDLGATVVLGVNVDDLGDRRPGQVAAADRGAVFPLVDAGLTKADVRRCARELGLEVWDKPAAACLASRIPHGTPVTLGTLGRIERAEAGLRRLGFRQLRVRHYGDLARIELEAPELARALDERAEVVAAVKAAGYRYVTLDLEGFRSGNLSAPVATGPRGT